MEREARYRRLHRSGELKDRAAKALERISGCRVCPRACGVDRLSDELGACRTGRLAQVASMGPHFGEESPLVGRGGSGTVFFSGCSLNCRFCQNADISQGEKGLEADARRLARIFLHVEQLGCVNLNLVTPTHVMPQVLEALDLAASWGLGLRLVWNCGGYESLASLALLDGVVDIYMPDLKFMDEEPSAQFLDAPDYPERVRAAIREMHRQVGDLEIDDQGLAVQGLLVRHLIMPQGLASSAKAIDFLAREISPATYLNVMDQYRPCHLARGDPEIGGYPEHRLWREARDLAQKAGLRLDR